MIDFSQLYKSNKQIWWDSHTWFLSYDVTSENFFNNKKVNGQISNKIKKNHRTNALSWTENINEQLWSQLDSFNFRKIKAFKYLIYKNNLNV